MRAYSYIVANGSDGLRRVAEGAVLNANWLRHRLRGTFDIPYDRPNMHEFVASATNLKANGVKAFDIAKGLLDEGFHAPTMYFPLIVAEALMIEPTETESLETLEELAQAFERVAALVSRPPDPRAVQDTRRPRRRSPRRPSAHRHRGHARSTS